MYAGINISGVNAEVMPAQWEYQVPGPGCCGLGGRQGKPYVRHLERTTQLSLPALCRISVSSSARQHDLGCWPTLCLCLGSIPPARTAATIPSLWLVQVGPCTGISMGDDLWMSRYILYRLAGEQGNAGHSSRPERRGQLSRPHPATTKLRLFNLPSRKASLDRYTAYPRPSLAELYNVEVTIDPKPIPGDWNGAGGHTNFSSKSTRQAETGWQVGTQAGRTAQTSSSPACLSLR